MSRARFDEFVMWDGTGVGEKQARQFGVMNDVCNFPLQLHLTSTSRQDTSHRSRLSDNPSLPSNQSVPPTLVVSSFENGCVAVSLRL